MAHKLGMDCKLYYYATPLTDTDYDSATWTEQTNVKDLTLNLETGESDITTRANSGWKATAATLKDGSLEWEMIWDPDDACFTAIQAAWAASAEIALAALDGNESIAGNQGLAGNFVITNFSRSEPNTEAVTVTVTAKPSSKTGWWVVTT